MQAEEAHKERVRSRVAKGQTLPDEPPQGAARACSLHHRFPMRVLEPDARKSVQGLPTGRVLW